LALSELVVDGNQRRAGPERAQGRDQPLGLVLHDDRATIVGRETLPLEEGGEALGLLPELAIGVTAVLAVPIGLDQRHVLLVGDDRVADRLPPRLQSAEIEHQSLLSMAAARAPKVRAPWSS